MVGESCKEIIIGKKHKLTKAEMKLANYILDNYDEVLNYNVTELADNAGEMLDFVNKDVMEAYKNMVDTGVTYHEDAEQMRKMMSNLQNSTEELSRAADEINEAAAAVFTAVSESSLGIDNAADYTVDISSHMGDINNSVDENMNVADSLQKEVAGFVCG